MGVVAWPRPACHRSGPCTNQQELQPGWRNLRLSPPYQPPDPVLACVSMCSRLMQSVSHLSWALVCTYGSCSLTRPTHPPTQATCMLTGAATVSSLTCSQPWFSCTPAGVAAQQRSAHSFATRPRPHPRSCALQRVRWSSLKLLAPSWHLLVNAVAEPSQSMLVLALARASRCSSQTAQPYPKPSSHVG